jgi:hypothetical protein
VDIKQNRPLVRAKHKLGPKSAKRVIYGISLPPHHKIPLQKVVPSIIPALIHIFHIKTHIVSHNDSSKQVGSINPLLADSIFCLFRTLICYCPQSTENCNKKSFSFLANIGLDSHPASLPCMSPCLLLVFAVVGTNLHPVAWSLGLVRRPLSSVSTK